MISLPVKLLCKLLGRVKSNEKGEVLFYEVSYLYGIYLSVLVFRSSYRINYLYLIDLYLVTLLRIKRVIPSGLERLNFNFNEKGIRCSFDSYHKEIIPLYTFKKSASKYHRILLNILIVKWNLVELRYSNNFEGIKDMRSVLNTQIEELSIKLKEHITNRVPH